MQCDKNIQPYCVDSSPLVNNSTKLTGPVRPEMGTICPPRCPILCLGTKKSWMVSILPRQCHSRRRPYRPKLSATWPTNPWSRIGKVPAVGVCWAGWTAGCEWGASLSQSVWPGGSLWGRGGPHRGKSLVHFRYSWDDWSSQRWVTRYEYCQTFASMGSVVRRRWFYRHRRRPGVKRGKYGWLVGYLVGNCSFKRVLTSKLTPKRGQNKSKVKNGSKYHWKMEYRGKNTWPGVGVKIDIETGSKSVKSVRR